jgi:lipoprotein-anchoring transpeptidase ErfK/SrfK
VTRIPNRAKAGLIVALVAVLVGAPAGVGWAAYQQDASMRGLLPKGTVVGGVDVSKLDRATAIAKVRGVVERDFDRVTGITVAGHTYTTSLRKLGVHDDAVAAVDRAFRTASSGNWVTRAWHRVVDGSSAPHEKVVVTDYVPTKVAAIVHKAAAELAVPATDADVHVSGGMLAFSRSRTGRALDEKAAVAAFTAALRDGTSRSVELTVVRPKVASVDTAILVRTGENKLYLYQHGKVTKTFGVATGSPRYPTPHGRFEVVLKRYLPTWVNPWSKWSMHEPARIGPGPNNPLGTRAMNLSAPGIRIHGTPSDSSIGYSVSHGCIRMHIPDVEALYDLVPTHTPVFIVSAGGYRLRGSAPVSDTANAADGG